MSKSYYGGGGVNALLKHNEVIPGPGCTECSISRFFGRVSKCVNRSQQRLDLVALAWFRLELV